MRREHEKKKMQRYEKEDKEENMKALQGKLLSSLLFLLQHRKNRTHKYKQKR